MVSTIPLFGIVAVVLLVLLFSGKKALPVVLVCAVLGGAIFFGLKKKAMNSQQPGGQPEIAVIPKGLTHDFWKAAHEGAKKAGAERGVTILWNGPPDEGARQKQINIVEDFITRRVTGVALAPLDSHALVPVVGKLKAANIPCVIFDSGINSDDYLSFVATDNYQGGVMAARRMGELLQSKGRVAVMKYAPNSASTSKRENGFMETIKKEFPTIELVDHRYAKETVATALATAEDILSAHKNLDGIFACNESTTVGTLQAIRSQKRQGITLIGFDSSTPLIDGLESGEIAALVVQNPFKMGYLSVISILDHLENKAIDKRIDTGVVLVAKEDLTKEEIKSLVGIK